MDIKDILDSLGIDLTNPDARKGAAEAIQAILDSRTPPPNISGAGAPGEKEIDVEIDPDLLQPSQKFNQPDSDADIEIEDEEDILSQVKHNESEDDLDSDGNSSGDDSSGDEADDNSPEGNSSGSEDGTGKSADSKGDLDDSNEADEGEESEVADNSDDTADGISDDEVADDDEGEDFANSRDPKDMNDTEEDDNSNESDDSDDSDDSNDSEYSDDSNDELKNSYEDQEDEDSDDANFDDDSEDEDDLGDEDDAEDDSVDADEDELEDEEDDSEESKSDENDEFDEDETDEDESDENDFEDEQSEEDEFEFDEDEFLDDELKNSYEDQEAKSKHDARRIKRERTLAAAKTALEKAKARNVSQSLINELEKSIEALESLTEAKAKSLAEISDEEFNTMVNRVFDAISAVGDNDLTFTSDEEREMRAQEIKTDLGSRETQQALSDEDIAAIRAETQAVKAREKETAIYRKPAASSFKGFQEFLNSLYRAVALQVQTNEIQDDTWSAINRRYSGTGVLKQGQRKNELPDRKIPVIDFYFDCSGSWGPADIEVGKKAVSTLVDMEEKGQIKINIYYFSNHVHNDMQSAINEGGTRAWNDIVKNVISTQATNVIIMTDGDMEDWWNGPTALKYTVPGYVWYLWRDGENAPRLPRDLKGRGGVQQFSFSHGDV